MREHAVVRMPLVQNRSLCPSGRPSSGRASPFASRVSLALACASACSGVGSTNVLRCGLAVSIAPRNASVSSTAENSFPASPSRASASVSLVRSVMSLVAWLVDALACGEGGRGKEEGGRREGGGGKGRGACCRHLGPRRREVAPAAPIPPPSAPRRSRRGAPVRWPSPPWPFLRRTRRRRAS